MAKAVISKVEQGNGLYMVTYATGTRRTYKPDAIPSTVAEWIRSNATAKPEPETEVEPQRKPETAAEPQEPQKIPETILEPEPEEIPVKEAKVPVKAEEPQKVTRMEKQPVPAIRQRSTAKPEPQKEAELPVKQEARTQPVTVATRTAPTAAEAVMYGVCIALMYIYEIVLGLASLTAIYVSGRIQRLWNHRAEIWNAILTGTTLTVKAILTAVVWTGAEIVKAVVIQMYLFNIRYSSL